MAVTRLVVPGRPRAELLLIDPYTFTEWETGMLAVIDTSALPEEFRILIDRRGAARPTSAFIGSMVSFFAANEARLAGTRAAVLVNIGVIEPLADLRVGRFRIRTFDDVTEAAEWLHRMARSTASDSAICRRSSQVAFLLPFRQNPSTR